MMHMAFPFPYCQLFANNRVLRREPEHSQLALALDKLDRLAAQNFCAILTLGRLNNASDRDLAH